MSPSHHGPRAGTRLVALDAIRTLTVWYVVLYHTLKDVSVDAASALAGPVIFATGLWRMPLMFLIAGASTEAMLRGMGARRFAAARVRRLVAPAAFTLAFVVPVIRYAHAYAHEAPLAYAAHAWSSLLDGGELRWYHIWFVAYLTAITAAAVAARAALRGVWARVVRAAPPAAAGARARAALLALGAATVLVQAVPTRVVEALPAVPGLDARLLASSAVFFAAGMVLGRAGGDLGALARRRRALAGGALAFAAVAGTLAFAHQAGDVLVPAVWVAGRAVALDEWALRLAGGAGAWFGALAVLAYGARYLRRPAPALEYLRDASFVVYLLHQAVLAWVARAAAGWAAPGAVRCVAVAAVTGAVTLALYEWVIRPTAAGRALFGVPDRAARTRRAAPAASPVRLPAGAVTPASAAAELATAGARRAGALALR